MEKKFIIWILTLTGCVLIYLAFTNRFAIYTITETREIIKYDRWTGKAWLIDAVERPEEKVEEDDYSKEQSKQIDSLLKAGNILHKQLEELQKTKPKRLSEIDSLIEEIFRIETEIFILNPNYLSIQILLGTPEDKKIETLSKEAEYLKFQLNKFLIEKPKKLQKIDSLTTQVMRMKKELKETLKKNLN